MMSSLLSVFAGSLNDSPVLSTGSAIFSWSRSRAIYGMVFNNFFLALYCVYCLSEYSYVSTASYFRICEDGSGKRVDAFIFTNFFHEVTFAKHSHARSRSTKLPHAAKLPSGLIFFVSYIKLSLFTKLLKKKKALNI